MQDLILGHNAIMSKSCKNTIYIGNINLTFELVVSKVGLVVSVLSTYT